MSELFRVPLPSRPVWSPLAPRSGNIRDSGSPFEVPDRGGWPRRKTRGNRILMLGRIRELALYRAAVLRDRGFDVATPHSHDDAISAIRRGNFDIAVLSYTLPNDEVKHLAELVREYCPECPVVAIVADRRRLDREIGPDAMVNADDGPDALLAALHRVRRPN